MYFNWKILISEMKDILLLRKISKLKRSTQFKLILHKRNYLVANRKIFSLYYFFNYSLFTFCSTQNTILWSFIFTLSSLKLVYPFLVLNIAITLSQTLNIQPSMIQLNAIDFSGIFPPKREA